MSADPRLSTRINEAKRGSVVACAEVFSTINAYVTALAPGKVKPFMRRRIRASSLAQEACSRAYQKFSQFNGESEQELQAWLYRIMLNCLISLLRQSNRRRVVALPENLPSSQATPADAVATAEELAAVKREMEQLPEEYRIAIEMRHFGRLTYEEIGIAMHCSTEAARKKCVRGKIELGKRLRKFQ